jgi:transcriptional regulator with XRE-family HTH domain
LQSGSVVYLKRQLQGWPSALTIKELASVGLADTGPFRQFLVSDFSHAPLVCTGQTGSQEARMVEVCCPSNDYPAAVLHTANVQDRNYLQQWREFRKLKQEELAEKVGTTKSVISLLENEKRPLSSKWLRKLATALDTTPGRILDVDPNETGAEILDIWDHIKTSDRARAVRVLRSLTGTDD